MWAIDPWSRMSQQQVVRSPDFGLAGSERTWMLSYTRDKAGFHLTCVGEAPSMHAACAVARTKRTCWKCHGVPHT